VADAKARLAFIGLGPMGKDLLTQAHQNPKAEVAALCDIDPEALAKASEIAGPGPVAYADYAELLAQEALDGVVVAVPQYLHARVSIDALNAGFHTFCEKPMGMNVAECESMIATAKRNAKGLMIGQVLRYIGVYRYMLELARSGELGKPFGVRVIRTMGKWGSPWTRPWRYKRETSGGLLLEVNVHEIDLMRCILGEAASVTAIGNRFINDEIDYEDLITATISFAQGGIGSLTVASCDFLGRYSGEVYLEQGSIYFDSVTQEVRIQRGGEETQVLPYAEVHPEWENGVYREMREFVEACLGEHPVTIPGEEGLRNVAIAEACYDSMKAGRSVSLT
jgi:UDP-N-acetylglucosamine 3-dehydrogenase